ncbi:MAG: AAA family ATPase [Candidatus Thiodiazotropha sp. (ex Dulcina madagascariensis)]|nr:AAA family ATPase [Candidatus Thiodiazotropha sp. (ex Dulcina madagascariensis)]
MLHKSDIMLLGRSRDAVSGISGMLEGQRLFSLRTHIFGNGRSIPWDDSERDPMPHVLALCLDGNWQTSLPAILQALPAKKPPFLVLSTGTNIELLRCAMQAGARDVLSPPYEVGNLTARLVELGREGEATMTESSARLIAFINAKGGSGASFLAANVAAALAGKRDRKTVLLDFDIQFGGLPIYLNMNPGGGLIKALEFSDTLDSAALPGYVQVHESGLHLFSSAKRELVLPDEIAEERIVHLLDVLDATYQEIIIDLPRRIDRPSAAILERLDRVVVVAQQSVTHMQDTKRLLTILNDHLGISAERVLIVVNRYSKKSEVRNEDFKNAFPGVAIETIPSDYAHVSASINLGVPVVDGAARSSLAKAILNLSSRLLSNGEPAHKRTGGMLGWLGLQARR